MLILLINCGGDGGSPIDNTVPSVVNWEQPTTYTDNSYLDPFTEIKYYHIYLNNTGSFDESYDNVAATLDGVDNNGLLMNKFNLTLIPDYIFIQNNIDKSQLIFVSIKSETFDGGISNFSEPQVWGEFK